MASRTLEIVTRITGDGKAGIEALNTSLNKLPASSGQAKSGIAGLASAVGVDLPAGFSAGVGGMVLAAGGLALLGKATVDAVNASREGRAVQAQLAAALESTRHAAGVSQEELNDYAEALQNVTNFDDEAIGSAQALLLTFTKVGRDVFPRATKTILDMSVAMDQDLKSSSIQLGKALNDPVNGMTALTRVGVTFTEEQKNMVSALVASNDLVGAQNIILDELQKEFGGSAEAARVADGGFIALGNSVANLYESFGNLITGANESLGIIEGLVGIVDNLTATVTAAGEAIQSGPVGALSVLTQIANPLAPIMAALGYDVIPGVTKASDEAAVATDTMAASMRDVTVASQGQLAAVQALGDATRNGLVSLGKLTEDHNTKMESLQLQRAEVTGNIYSTENAEIRAKLQERLGDINRQIREEERLYEEKAEKLKRLIAAQALEQSGQLEAMTGIAGITAQQYVDAVEYGAIQANREVESQIAGIEKGFEGAQKNVSSLVAQNQAIIQRAHESSFASITSAHNTQTNNAITNWERQRQAADRAVSPIFRPGSPTPFEIGLRGIASAANSVSESFAGMGPLIAGAAAPASELVKAREGAKGFWATASGKAYAASKGVGGKDSGWTQLPNGTWRRKDGSIWDHDRQVQLVDSSGKSRYEDTFYSGYSFGPEGFDPGRYLQDYATGQQGLTRSGGGSAPVMVVNYSPAVSLGNQAEVTGALKGAFETLMRERESR